MGQYSFHLLLFWHFHIRKGKRVIILIGRPLLYGWFISELHTSVAYPTIDGGHVALLLSFHYSFIQVRVNKIDFASVIFHGVCSMNTEPILTDSADIIL